MGRIGICFALLFAAGSLQSQSAQPQDAAVCKPQVIRKSKPTASSNKNEVNFEGYRQAPIVSFEVDETGKIQNAKITRSSGSSTADKYAIDEVRRMRYKPRPGCGTLETQAELTIDFY